VEGKCPEKKRVLKNRTRKRVDEPGRKYARLHLARTKGNGGETPKKGRRGVWAEKGKG